MQRVKLGGAEQSILIRGRSAKAPILIWLHGGPGQDETGLWRRYNAALEDKFTVVYWVQRGTGRSWSADIPPSSMRLSRFVGDLDELVDMLRRRFGQARVAIAGHSWGTSVGVAYTQSHPDKVSAYIGVSQVVAYEEGERRSYAYTLAEAKRRKNAAALAELKQIGPPPYPFASLLKQRWWLNEFGGAWRKPRSLPLLMWQSFQASEMTLLDGVYFMRGQDFSSDNLQDDMASVNWMRDAQNFQVPVFIAAGRFDYNTDARLQHEYFERINAPAKTFRWFENSAHSPLFEEPEEFNRFMLNTVHAAALARSR